MYIREKGDSNPDKWTSIEVMKMDALIELIRRGTSTKSIALLFKGDTK